MTPDIEQCPHCYFVFQRGPKECPLCEKTIERNPQMTTKKRLIAKRNRHHKKPPVQPKKYAIPAKPHKMINIEICGVQGAGKTTAAEVITDAMLMAGFTKFAIQETQLPVSERTSILDEAKAAQSELAALRDRIAILNAELRTEKSKTWKWEDYYIYILRVLVRGFDEAGEQGTNDSRKLGRLEGRVAAAVTFINGTVPKDKRIFMLNSPSGD